MNYLYDVAVIGAGPAGSYIASLLASSGHRVLVLDRQRASELAPLCTGIVGVPYMQLLGIDDDVVLARASSATVYSPLGRSLRVVSPRVEAYVLDRALLEQQLRRRAVGAGAQMFEGITVSNVHREAGRWLLSGVGDGCRESFEARAVVLATGVGPELARRLGLTPPRSSLVGAHMEMEMDGVDETEVYSLPDLAPGAFGWLVPVGSDRVRVGVLASSGAIPLTRLFLERSAIRHRVRSSLTPLLQRPVPVGGAARTCATGVVSIGDAAGQVKSTTGGGLYFGALAARAAASALETALEKDDLSVRALMTYQRQWRKDFLQEIERGMLVRRAYNRMSPQRVDDIIRWAAGTGLPARLFESGSFSFDRHTSTLFFGLLRSLPWLMRRSNAPTPEVDA